MRRRVNSLKKPKRRPLRTRDHVIADLSRLHVQRIVAKCGYVAETPEHDYGYDLAIFTYTEAGEVENGCILLQLKATDTFARYPLDAGEAISFPIGTGHLALWRDEPMPVILVVYDALQERAHWLYIQQYLRSVDLSVPLDQTHVSLRIPLTNEVDRAAIQQFRRFKADVLRRLKEVSLHREKSDVQPD